MFTGLKDVLVALPTSDGKTLPIVVSAMVKHFFNSDGTKRKNDEPKPFTLLLVPRTATRNDLYDTMKKYFTTKLQSDNKIFMLEPKGSIASHRLRKNYRKNIKQH